MLILTMVDFADGIDQDQNAQMCSLILAYIACCQISLEYKKAIH